MPKGKPGGGFSVIGTDGDDLLSLPNGATLLNATVDGRRGNDTLDLSSYTSSGVYVRLESGFAKAKSGVAEKPFTGIFGNYTLSDTTVVGGSLKNIENLIGTSGNDVLFVQSSSNAAKRVDGGAGNDVVQALGGNATLIGGLGSDWLVSYWEGNVLIGGVDDGDLTTSDSARDVYYLGSAPTILDYEVEFDHLLVELTSGQSAQSVYAPGAIEWRSEGTGAALYINGVREVFLANIDPDTAQGIEFGLVVSPVDNVVSGGPGDDMLYAGGHTTATTVMVGPDNGHDVVMNFTLSLDTLQFAPGLSPMWSNTIVNGASALVATFAGGSLTFQGLTMNDVDAMLILGDRGTLAGSSLPVESAWSVESDFPPMIQPASSPELIDWLI